MSRISRYQESIKKFITNRISLSDFNNDNSKMIKKHLSSSDYIFPIILLTILNNQNKKNGISYQGYYAALSVEFIKIILDTEDNQNISNDLVLLSIKLLFQNIDTIKRYISADKILASYSSITELIIKYTNSNGINANIKILLLVNFFELLKGFSIKHQVSHAKRTDNIQSAINRKSDMSSRNLWRAKANIG